MSDKIYIKLTHNADKQAGDNRPSFVAPINPKSPAGKNLEDRSKDWRELVQPSRI